MDGLGYLTVLFGGLDVKGENDVAAAVVRETRKAELTAITDALCGEVLRVVPLRLSNKLAADCHRSIEHCNLESDTFSGERLGGRFDFLHNLAINSGTIAAHAQVNSGLSGAFSFFLMREDDVILRWEKQSGITSTGLTKPARLEGIMGDAVAQVCLAMLNAAMTSIPAGMHFSFQFRENNLRTSQKLMVTLRGLSYPNSHSDGKEEGPVDECRILWDLHPRGRILSVYTQEYGVFLENCGVEFCSQTMCGRKTMPGNHMNIAASKLQHQGCDDCPARPTGCPMVTALFDLRVVRNDGQPINNLDDVMNAINQTQFKNALKQEMEDYVSARMREWKVDGLAYDAMQTQLREQNHKVVQRWWRNFYRGQPVPPLHPLDNYLDVATDSYLAQLYNRV
jgi:hypothetical protein